MTDSITELIPCKIEDLSAKVGDMETEMKKSKKQKAIEWGRPGHLTKEEVEIFIKFRDEVNKRGGEFLNTVYSFTFTEGEAYTLTRWLRARKYNLTDTITMVEEATECRSSPRTYDYYPDPTTALGCPPNLYLHQYPQLYSGFSKIGCPVFYSKPGQLDIDGLECVTSLNGILKYHWHVMQHDYTKRLLKFKSENPNFKRFECVSILDLKHLTISKISSRSLDITKEQATIDSLCFPETMNKMIIVNAPRFFSATWTIIKGFIDARTSAKVELFSSSSAALKCMKEIIDDDQIPSDYGGTGESTIVTMENMGEGKKINTQVLYVKTSDSAKVEIGEGEEAEIGVYTRSTEGAEFHILDEGKKDLVPVVKVKHGSSDADSAPTKIDLTVTGKIQGPNTVKVKGIAFGGGSMFATSQNYLVVSSITKKD